MTKAIAVFNADISISDGILREMLQGPHRKHFPLVKAFTHSSTHSGNLAYLGAEVSCLSEEVVKNELGNVHTVILTPDCSSDTMFQESLRIIRQSQFANVQRFFLNSIIWECKAENQTSERFRMLEEYLVKRIQNWTIIRMGYFQNNFLYWTKEVSVNKRITIPLSKEQIDKIKIAPISLYDVGKFMVECLIKNEKTCQKTFHLSGHEMISMREIVGILDSVLGNPEKKITIKSVESKDMEARLRENLSDTLIQHIMDGFHMWKFGCFSNPTDDFKKMMKRETQGFKEFFEEHALRFHKY
jgi:hypothetical protein